MYMLGILARLVAAGHEGWPAALEWCSAPVMRVLWLGAVLAIWICIALELDRAPWRR